MREYALKLGRREFLSAAALAAGAYAAVGCSPGPATVAGPASTSPPAEQLGRLPLGFALGSSVLWASPDELNRTMDQVAASGATMVRFDVSWTFAESSRGQYEWRPSDAVVAAATARQLAPLMTITNSPRWANVGGYRQTGRPADPAVYAKFVAEVVGRYHETVHSWEIWNEPNGRMFFEPGADAALYTAMLREAYESVKNVDPKATVIAGALGAVGHTDDAVASVEFLRQMYAGGAADHFDALSYHPYDYATPLAAGSLYENAPMRQMVAMHELMAVNGDGGKPIWITEYGAPSSKVGDAEQASLIIDSFRAWQEVSYAGPFFVYTARDAVSSSPNDEDRFGVVTDAYLPKQAFTGLKDLMAQGIPLGDVHRQFQSGADPQLGGALTPVFDLPDGHGQQFEHGFQFQTANGFISSPTEVGDAALPWKVVPDGPFAEGVQNFGPGSEMRVFSRQDTGTHVVVGGILAAWEPSLGFPITDEYTSQSGPWRGQRVVEFEHGTIAWSSADGATVNR